MNCPQRDAAAPVRCAREFESGPNRISGARHRARAMGVRRPHWPDTRSSTGQVTGQRRLLAAIGGPVAVGPGVPGCGPRSWPNCGQTVLVKLWPNCGQTVVKPVAVKPLVVKPAMVKPVARAGAMAPGAPGVTGHDSGQTAVKTVAVQPASRAGAVAPGVPGLGHGVGGHDRPPVAQRRPPHAQERCAAK